MAGVARFGGAEGRHDVKNVTDAECREWVELGIEVAQQQNEGDPGCKCATCLVFVSLADIVKGRESAQSSGKAGGT
jgi:hypothetical protein